MADQSVDTRTEIIEAARTEFFAHGYEGARLQNISDRIGVTKAMIHYYFNTKKELFVHVYSQSVQEIFGGLDEIIAQDIPLFKKIEQLVEACLKKSEDHPDILTFVITESSRKPDWLQPIFEEQIQLELSTFKKELDEAASNYQIASVDPQNLLLNIFSLCYYTALAANINKPMLNLNSSGENITDNMKRKGIVLDTILNWLTA
jgi:AcrR family transcriptional regulator